MRKCINPLWYFHPSAAKYRGLCEADAAAAAAYAEDMKSFSLHIPGAGSKYICRPLPKDRTVAFRQSYLGSVASFVRARDVGTKKLERVTGEFVEKICPMPAASGSSFAARLWRAADLSPSLHPLSDPAPARALKLQRLHRSGSCGPSSPAIPPCIGRLIQLFGVGYHLQLYCLKYLVSYYIILNKYVKVNREIKQNCFNPY
ncbi:MAG: hypothetical protein IJG45_08845 [Oscillospiraceae bacterium]|nr:hypothetical protein [Oscillospiraceae bacterium]